MKPSRKILITFDVEEFDVPLEYKQAISIEEQLKTGFKGLQQIQSILDSSYMSSTLFTTAFFAKHYPTEILALSAKHEIASHGLSHTSFKAEDLAISKKQLEALTGKEVYGFRMPRLQKINAALVAAAGYSYNSSINPTFLPGRYNNLHSPRKPFWEKQFLQFPLSVTPHLRIPLFWLAFKNMPYFLYLRLVLQVLSYDGYVCLYFHPWEFTDLSAYRIPSYIKKGSNHTSLKKMKRLVNDLSKEGEMITMHEYITEKFL